MLLYTFSYRWDHNKTVCYLGTDAQNSVLFHGVSASINPNISAGIGATISRLVWGDISAETVVKRHLSINYANPVLAGFAGLDGKLYLKATAEIGNIDYI